MGNYQLPQTDSNSNRQAELNAVSKDYSYNYDYGIPIASSIHPRDKANPIWTLKVLRALFKDRSNAEAVLIKSAWKPLLSMPQKSPKEIAGYLAKKDLKQLFLYYNPDLGAFQPDGRPKSLEDYALIFQKVSKPYNIDKALSDSHFAHTFVAGANPNMFSKLKLIPSNFPVSNDHLRKSPTLAGDDINQALAAGRLFIVDYKELNSLVSGVHPQQKKYIYQPIVLFARTDKGRDLVPVAIQCGQNPAEFPILTPADNWSWHIAKATVYAAQHCHHELLTHLGYTHLLIEPIVVATRRQLHSSHPVYGLLSPHFEGTMPINFLAVTKLIQPGESVDRLVGSNKDSNYALIAKQRLAYSFKANYLPARLESMGVSSPSDLPNYHYRDDALPLWQAIRNWVSSYIGMYYADDATVRADGELQAWAREISANDGGQIRDFASNGGINDRNELIETCTMIIFTSGPQHAAVNFPQVSDMAYTPCGMLAGYREAPRSRDHTKQDYLDMLPPLDVALKAWQSLNFLGSVYYGKLGFYSPGHFMDARVLTENAKFLGKLGQIEMEINDRNRNRVPYTHLLPSKVPQSINI